MAVSRSGSMRLCEMRCSRDRIYAVNAWRSRQRLTMTSSPLVAVALPDLEIHEAVRVIDHVRTGAEGGYKLRGAVRVDAQTRQRDVHRTTGMLRPLQIVAGAVRRREPVRMAVCSGPPAFCCLASRRLSGTREGGAVRAIGTPPPGVAAERVSARHAMSSRTAATHSRRSAPPSRTLPDDQAAAPGAWTLHDATLSNRSCP
jgi:hypothetical protein